MIQSNPSFRKSDSNPNSPNGGASSSDVNSQRSPSRLHFTSFLPSYVPFAVCSTSSPTSTSPDSHSSLYTNTYTHMHIYSFQFSHTHKLTDLTHIAKKQQKTTLSIYSPNLPTRLHMSIVAATTAAAVMVLLIAVIAVFLAFVLCFYLFLCAKRYHGAAPTLRAGSSTRSGSRFFFFSSSSSSLSAPVAEMFCHDRGVDDKTIAASLPATLAEEGGADCAVCLSEVAAGEMARLLPRCGHGFHVECVDMWLRSHSTCPLCRCPVLAELPPESYPGAVQLPEADPESPIFPTNVLFFGSQDEVSTGGGGGGAAATEAQARAAAESDAAVPARIRTIRRLLGRGGCGPRPAAADADIEMGMGGGAESSLSQTSSPATKPPAAS